MAKVKNIIAREIKDSRGNPTVEVVLETDKGEYTASVPSGASTGKNEALELRDGEKRYGGMGVLKAVSNVNFTINNAVKGMDANDLRKLDATMIALDGMKLVMRPSLP